MVINTKKMLSIGFICFNTVLYAGSMGPTASYSGLWAGLGGGYINTTTTGNTNINMVSVSSSPREYLLNNNLENHFAPLANVGYFFDLSNSWLVGVKGVYKYINSEQFDQSFSGTFQDGTYQTAGLHTKLEHEAFFLLDGGYQFGNWLVYGGLGPSINTVSEVLNGDVLPPTSFNFLPVNITTNKTLWGGAGQIGFEYLLPNRFMVDISYNLVVTGKTTMPTILFRTGASSAYTSFSQQVQVVEQGVSISINKYFML